MKKLINGSKILISIIIPYHKKKSFFMLLQLNLFATRLFKNYEVILIYDDNEYGENYLLLKIN